MVPTWELDDFFRDLRQQVVGLESAWLRNRLEPELESVRDRPEAHPPVLAAYDRLLRRRRLSPAPYRGRAVHALLDEAKRELFELPHRFDAQPVDFQRGPSTAPEQRGTLENPEIERVGGVSARSARGECYLRMDQVLAARAWGIQFSFDSPEVSDRVNTLAALTTVERLGHGLIGLEKIERRFENREVDPDLQIVPPQAGRGFEALIADILNEHYPLARQAPLVEDFFEKTDLRLHVRGLARRRGARAQVTRITDAQSHAAKLDQIRGIEEFVVLSPLTLARAVCAGTAALGWSREDELLFWQCFPEPPTTEEELAVALRDLLIGAMERPTAGPRGPLAAVPEPVRLLVQSYATTESFATTERMRSRIEAERTAQAC